MTRGDAKALDSATSLRYAQNDERVLLVIPREVAELCYRSKRPCYTADILLQLFSLLKTHLPSMLAYSPPFFYKRFAK